MTGSETVVVVIGGGPAGCAAALEAARLGLTVTLVDEHPQPAAGMALDAPYFYGARFSPLLASARATAARVLNANTALMDCVEAGVDVLTGTVAWGLFRPGPNSRHVGGTLVGLADEKRSWCLPYDHLVLAAGARDLVLGFPGWQLPGVLGVLGATKLLTSYQGFEARRIVVLGSGNAGLVFAKLAADQGLGVAGIC